MSWSASILPVRRDELSAAIDAATSSPVELDVPSAAQFDVAKTAAKTLAGIVPGPKLSVTMSGHANGVGDAPREGFANDFVTITVSQTTD